MAYFCCAKQQKKLNKRLFSEFFAYFASVLRNRKIGNNLRNSGKIKKLRLASRSQTRVLTKQFVSVSQNSYRSKMDGCITTPFVVARCCFLQNKRNKTFRKKAKRRNGEKIKHVAIHKLHKGQIS
jgi:hypothetical protein